MTLAHQKRGPNVFDIRPRRAELRLCAYEL
jgi:hypothetical protein